MTWASPVLQIWTVFQHRLISYRQLCLTCVFLLFEVIYSFWIIGVLNSFCSTSRQVSWDYAVKRKGSHIYSTVTFPVTVVPLLGFARGWVWWRKRERRKCKKWNRFYACTRRNSENTIFHSSGREFKLYCHMFRWLLARLLRGVCGYDGPWTKNYLYFLAVQLSLTGFKNVSKT